MKEDSTAMDMNQLLYNHQLAMLNVQHPRSATVCRSSFDLVGHYAGRIADWRLAAGLSVAGWPAENLSEGINL